MFGSPEGNVNFFWNLFIIIVVAKIIWIPVKHILSTNESKKIKLDEKDKLMFSYYTAIRLILNKLRWKYKVNAIKKNDVLDSNGQGFYNEDMLEELEEYNKELLLFNQPFMMIGYANSVCNKIDKEMNAQKKQPWKKHRGNKHD